jgi:peptide/nickel transport system permease protein
MTVRHSASIMLLCAVLAFALAKAWPDATTLNRIDLSRMFALPQPGMWLGADELGRPIGPRVLAGAAISLPVAASVVAISLVVGCAFGVICAWRGGLVDLLGARVLDVLLAFPGMLLAIALAGVLGPGIGNVVTALCLVGWVGFARLARAQTASVTRREHVLAARSLGTSTLRILWRHVLPYVVVPLLVESVFSFAATLAAEAGLSFLGLGAQPPVPTWGAMLREAAQFLLVAPHMLIGPGLALVSAVLAVQAVGERLRLRWQTPH